MDTETRQAFKEIRTDISSLKKDVSILKKDVSILKKDGRSLKKEVSDFKKEFNNFRNETNDRFDVVLSAIDEAKKETMRHFEVIAENIRHDIAGVNKDEISLITQQHNLLEKRVQVVEQKVGV